MKKKSQRNRSFQPSAAGKGDADRTTDVDAFRANYDAIDWSRRSARIDKAVDESRKRFEHYTPEERRAFGRKARESMEDPTGPLPTAGAFPLGYATWDGYYKDKERS